MIYNRTHKDNKIRYSINMFMLTAAKTGLAILRISIQLQIPKDFFKGNTSMLIRIKLITLLQISCDLDLNF